MIWKDYKGFCSSLENIVEKKNTTFPNINFDSSKEYDTKMKKTKKNHWTMPDLHHIHVANKYSVSWKIDLVAE